MTQAAQSPAQALQRLQLILGYVWYLGRGQKLWYNAEIMVQPPRVFMKFSIQVVQDFFIRVKWAWPT